MLHWRFAYALAYMPLILRMYTLSPSRVKKLGSQGLSTIKARVTDSKKVSLR